MPYIAKHKKMVKQTGIPIILIILTAIFAQYSAFSTGSGEIKSLRTVVIDPGHGGHDPGAVSAGIREKDIVLDIALRLGKKINQSYPDVRVIYTRDKDVFVPLFQRANVANRNKADIFISLHANYVSSPSANGTETFTLGLHRSQENLEVAKKENSVILLEDDYSANYEGFDPREAESYIMFENLQSEYQGQSIDFAAQIQDYFGKNLSLTDRGVKQAGFLVLRRASMPSVLVEVGFISNPNERKFLVSDAGKEKISESIFQAFSSYKKNIDNRSRFNLAHDDNNLSIPSEKNETIADVTETGNFVSGRNNQTTGSAIKPQNTTSTTLQNKQGAGNNPAPVTSATTSQPWFAVQVAAVQREIATTPSNFKGEKNITRLKVGNINKYVYGRFVSFAEATKERDRLKSKFPGAFVVSVENGIPSPVKK